MSEGHRDSAVLRVCHIQLQVSRPCRRRPYENVVWVPMETGSRAAAAQDRVLRAGLIASWMRHAGQMRHAGSELSLQGCI